MIELSMSEAIFFYFLLWLGLIIVLWWREQRRLKRNEWKLNRSHLFNCDNCHHAFITDEPVNLARCPRCNAVCFRRKQRGME